MGRRVATAIVRIKCIEECIEARANDWVASLVQVHGLRGHERHTVLKIQIGFAIDVEVLVSFVDDKNTTIDRLIDGSLTDEALGIGAEEHVKIGWEVTLGSILDNTVGVGDGFLGCIVDTVKCAQTGGGNRAITCRSTGSVVVWEGAQVLTHFRLDVAAVTGVKGGLGSVALVLADMNVEVGGGSDEVDMVFDRSGDGVRGASNVWCARGAVLVDFVCGPDYF